MLTTHSVIIMCMAVKGIWMYSPWKNIYTVQSEETFYTGCCHQLSSFVGWTRSAAWSIWVSERMSYNCSSARLVFWHRSSNFNSIVWMDSLNRHSHQKELIEHVVKWLKHCARKHHPQLANLANPKNWHLNSECSCLPLFILVKNASLTKSCSECSAKAR